MRSTSTKRRVARESGDTSAGAERAASTGAVRRAAKKAASKGAASQAAASAAGGAKAGASKAGAANPPAVKAKAPKARAPGATTGKKGAGARKADGPKARAARGKEQPAPSEAERRRAAEVIDRLDAAMPDAHIELDFSNDLELLVAVMLSAQCTDAMVNRCTPGLFARYRTAADYAAAQPEDLYPYISRCGLYRNKAKNIVAAMQAIERDHGGELPRTREELEKLPGVGRKTAGVVAVYALDGQAFPVDTHVGRLARRLGFTRHEDPDKVELDMQRLLPPERWGKAHQLLVWHGRRCCYARKPACSRCPVADLCPRIGVTDAA